MHPQRRSGRIAKELQIVLLGADTAGKVFAEETKTVVLSRHGAGIVSRNKFAPDEVLTLRLAGSSREAEVRLVGQIGGELDRYVYGVAFLDPDIEFWPMEFPPPEPLGPSPRRVTLSCSFCNARQTVEPDDIEEDVYSVNGNVLRYCESCGSSTPWTKTRGESIPAEVAPALVRDLPSSARLAPPLAATPAPEPPEPIRVSVNVGESAVSEPEGASSSPAALSSYSATAIDTLATTDVEFNLTSPPAEAPASRETQSAAAPDDAVSSRPVEASGKRVNRRKHMRVRVDFRACVRQGEWGDDIVECKNVSKGGLCFHSRRKYALDSVIEVAAPYSLGEPALFVRAKIRRSERLADGESFLYGVSYLPRS